MGDGETASYRRRQSERKALSFKIERETREKAKTMTDEPKRTQSATCRCISTIAHEILADWSIERRTIIDPYHTGVNAAIHTMTQMHVPAHRVSMVGLVVKGNLTGRNVILGFLNGASSWNTPRAKEIKEELKRIAS